MYDLNLVAEEAETFREAVLNGDPYRPLYVKLKLIWTCNLRCGMCNHWRYDKEQPLDTDKMLAAIAEMAQLGCRKIHISGGEPTMHPDLPAMMAHAIERGIKVTMTTNATLITKRMAREFGAAGLRGVNVSIDSPTSRIHDRIRGMSGAWKKAVKGVRRLNEKLKRPKIRINTVVGPLNYRSLDGLPDFAAGIGACSINLIPLDENTDDMPGLSKRQIADFNAHVAPVIAERGMALGLIESPAEAYPFGTSYTEICHSKAGFYAQGYYEKNRCFAPWTHTLIDHLGQVSPCCMLRESPIILGDLRQQSFTEVWTGSAYTELRQRETLPLYGRCRRCDDFLVENQQMAAIMNAVNAA